MTIRAIRAKSDRDAEELLFEARLYDDAAFSACDEDGYWHVYYDLSTAADVTQAAGKGGRLVQRPPIENKGASNEQ